MSLLGGTRRVVQLQRSWQLLQAANGARNAVACNAQATVRMPAARAFSTMLSQIRARVVSSSPSLGRLQTSTLQTQGWTRLGALWTAAGPASAMLAVAFCEGENDSSKEPQAAQSTSSSIGIPIPSEAEHFIDETAKIIGSNVTDFLDTGIPSQVTAGFVAGYCMGFATKKSLKVLVFGSGVILVSLQALAYKGYIKTSWASLSDDFVMALDANGDGVIDSQDAKIWWSKASEVVGYNLPAGSGWMGGWIMGLRSG